MAVTNRVILKGRCVVMPESLKKQALEQLHVKHIGIKNQTNGIQINLLDKYQ